VSEVRTGLAPYRQPIDAVLSSLSTEAHSGLTGVEARARLARYGANELRAKPRPPAWTRFLAQFKNALVLLLLAATAISAALWLMERDTALPYEAITIFVVVLLNAALGYAQEARAEQAVAALKQMSAAQAHVVRDGRRQAIPAAEVVPGDILVVEEGDTVAADARLIHAAGLQTAESALTGESLPVEKDARPLDEDAGVGDRHNMLWSGTAVTSGRGRAVVVATGMRTEMGRIAGLLEAAAVETTPLQRQLDAVGRTLGLAVLVIAVVMIAAILFTQDVRGLGAWFDVFIVGVALAVAAVPEGLPAIVTVVLSLGVQRAARRKAIVRHLSAVETLGSASVIASDKTGTLTRNEMTVRVAVTASGRVRFAGTGYAPEGAVEREGGGAIEGDLREELLRLLAAADRANNAVLQRRVHRWVVEGDPTEGALIVAARKAGLEGATLDARFQRVAEVPFTSARKLMSTVHTDAERRERFLTITKGAPDVLLARCRFEQVGEATRAIDARRREEILRCVDTLAADALRTLGVAYRSQPIEALDVDAVDDGVEEEMVFLGLVGMIDPPRDEAKEAVARAHAAGIRTVLITGDHPVTASVIARELGVAGDARTATGAQIEGCSDSELDRTVREVSVFARVAPEDKLRIVQALQRGGAVVAMTGDGVNDAPALKTADIGVAMGIAGTDVSREAADMILADDNFATIVAAVEEGRAIYANIRKFLRYLLSSNIGEVMTMFLGVVFAKTIGLTSEGEGMTLPLLATQLLWINLVTDGAPALALGLDPAGPGLMARPPRPRTEGVLNRPMWAGILFVGAVIALGTLFVLDVSLPGGLIEGSGDTRHAHTMAFTTVVLFSLFNLFNARSDTTSAFAGIFDNKWVWHAIALSLALQVAVVYVPFLQTPFSTAPLSMSDWLVCGAVGSSVLWVRELSKVVARARTKSALSTQSTERGERP